jgi:nicotinate-nucleotide--dimethylbenzimidazole phosphoribosyltransferase
MRFAIPEPDGAAAQAATFRQSRLTKPAGSLGRLEELAIQMAAAQRCERPRARPAAAILFAADHPVAARGVSAYPVEVTAAMVRNFAVGGAASSVATRTLGVPLTVVDVGVRGASATATGAVTVRRAEVAEDPVGDIAVEDAMSDETCARAIAAGARAVDALPEETRVVVLGEMGIGNTTVASAVAAALLDEDAAGLTGAGTGVAGAALEAKRAVVAAAAARARGCAPLEALARVGGRELAALVGAAGRAAERRMIVLVDGFIVSVAMLVLVRHVPAARPYLVFAHRSREAGHGRVLDALDAQPLLDLGLRLGEGSGALAAFPLVDLACALHDEMATFDEAAVPERRS